MALVISGGHTELVYLPKEYTFEVLGTTLDDAVGECYDKVARVIEVGYPGGPVIDKIAKNGELKYKLPTPLNDESYNFSFSGLKSAVINLAHNEKQRGNAIEKASLACSFQEVVSDVLTKKTKKALKEYNINYLITAGGVAANSEIRRKLALMCEENNIEYSFPDISFCTDNASMIAAAAYFLYKRGKFETLDLNAESTIPLK